MINKIIIKNHTNLSEIIIYHEIYKLIRDKKIHNNHNQSFLDNVVEYGLNKYLIRYVLTERNTKIYHIYYKENENETN